MPYPAQLERKVAAVREALDAYGLSRPELVAAPRGAPDVEAYRLRAKLVVGPRGIGLFASGTHEIVDTPACVVLRPVVARAVAALRGLDLARAGVTTVDLREVDDGVLLTLAAADTAALGDLVALLHARVPALVGLGVSSREADSPRLLGRAPQVLAGPSAARHRLDPSAPYHYAGHGAFTQAHPAQLVALHQHLQAELTGRLGSLAGRRLLELYAGTGALGLRLAAEGARVTLVEAFAPGMALAARAAAEQGLSLETLASDAAAALGRLTSSGARFDAVLVNPPRRGLAPVVRRALVEHAPQLLLYVSCAPATLARDAAHFARLGLRLATVAPYDMIPLSDAVESVAVFTPAAAPPPRLLFEDATLLAVYKEPHEPVTPQGEHRGSLLERVRRELGAPAAVPVHRLDLGTSGVCLFARAPGQVPALARALAAGEKTYLALARGVTHRKGIVRRDLLDAGRCLVATTRYAARRRVGGHSLLAVRPEQGRTHQIRRHLAGVGHPVVGDARYGERHTNLHFEHRHGLDRSFLHLESVRLSSPDGELLLHAPLAPDLAAVLASLGRR